MTMKKTTLLILAVLAVFLATGAAADGWTRPEAADAYRRFIAGGAYEDFIHTPDPEFEEMVKERDRKWDRFCLHDLDGDGTPELIILLEYGIEQADVFLYNGSVEHAGTMGGDNFFQFFAYYGDGRFPGLFTFKGGIAMKIDQYTLENGKLKERDIGMTLVDYEGEETIGLDLKVSDPGLYDVLLNTATGAHDTSRQPDWYLLQELQQDSAWAAFFNSAGGLR